MFKDDLREDLTVFLSTAEFGELIEVDGVTCAAQVISHTADKTQRVQGQFDGLLGDFTTIYIKAEPFLKKRKKLPQKGDWIKIQGRRYDVAFSQEQKGLIKIEASAYRQPTPRLYRK